MSGEVLFRDVLKAFDREGGVKEVRCELLRKPAHMEVRLIDESDLFNVLISRVEESGYEKMKLEQGIRVEYLGFVKKFAEMLEKAKEGRLVLLLSSASLKVLERSDFKNIVQIELPVKMMGEEQFKSYVSEVLGELQTENARYRRENAYLKEEAQRKTQISSDRARRLEEELEEARKTAKEAVKERNALEQEAKERREKNAKSSEDLARYVRLYEQIASEAAAGAEKVARAKETEEKLREKEKQHRTLEEDLRKANEIIKRGFEEAKERRKAETALASELEAVKIEKEEALSGSAHLEAELEEKREEVRALEEMERERKEVIDSLKMLNRSLSKKLETAYRVYARLYGRTGAEKIPEEDDTRTEENTSSVIAPESVQY